MNTSLSDLLDLDETAKPASELPTSQKASVQASPTKSAEKQKSKSDTATAKNADTTKSAKSTDTTKIADVLDVLPNYSLLRDNPELFLQILEKNFPQLAATRNSLSVIIREITLQVSLIDSELDEAAKAGAKSSLNLNERAQLKQKKDEYLEEYGKLRKLVVENEEECEEAIISLYSHGKNARQLSPNYRTNDDFSTESTLVPVAARTELEETVQNSPIKYQTPQHQELALCLSGVNATSVQAKNPAWLAKRTGLSIAEVCDARNDAHFCAYVAAIANHMSKELVRRGLNTKIQRLQNANAMLEGLQNIQFERSMYYSSPDEVSDDELLQMGLNPDKRDLRASMIPGANSGLMKKTPVVIRHMVQGQGQQRGNRTELIETWEIDSDLLRQHKVWSEYISKELGEYGTDKTGLVNDEIKTYKGFDPSSV